MLIPVIFITCVFQIEGKEAIGPLVDFAILMYHNGKLLYEANSGPYFYLSKLEGASEASLWNEIFVWAQNELGLPQGTIKACVLIENIVSSFELEEILYALRDHSLGLNCGIWDYCASIISKFGNYNIHFALTLFSELLFYYKYFSLVWKFIILYQSFTF